MEQSSQDSALIKPFQALNSNALRRRALEGLVHTLTHQQIRELQSAIEKIDLHCDIITKLPLEISQIILQYLPLHEIFRARRVSSKWKQLLSTSQTVEASMRDWYPQHGNERGLHIPAGLSAEHVASLTAEHVDAYRTGNACKCAVIIVGDLADSLATTRVDYADGIMAWVDHDVDDFLVKLLDLKTGQKWSFVPETRPYINAIAVSSSMLALLGRGRCYVLALETGYNHFVQLPSDRAANIAVSGGSLAMVWGENSTGLYPYISAITWTLKNQKALSFTLPFPYPRGQNRTIFDNRGETLLLFSQVRVSNSDESIHFHYIRTSLDGIVLAQGVIPADLKDYRDSSEGYVPKEANGQALIWSFVKSQPESGDSSELMLVCYDFRKDRLEVRKQIVTGLHIRRRDIYSRSSRWKNSPIFHWKDTAYFLDYDDDEGRYLNVVNLQDSTCSKAKMSIPKDTQELVEAFIVEPEEMQVLIFGDETFFIVVFGQGFCVWCFDAHTPMFDENIAFREQRRTRFEKRIRLKQDEKNHGPSTRKTRVVASSEDQILLGSNG